MHSRATRLRIAASFLFIFLLSATQAPAQSAAAPIAVRVDLREAPRRILHAHLEIPAAPGPLTLLYPQWIPGEHGPTGPIANLAGLKITANGKTLPWRRDDVDMYAFRCEVPAGAAAVEVDLDYLSPTEERATFTASPVSTDQLAVLNWNLVVLYPQGHPVAELTYAARLELPVGWSFGTALPVARQVGASVEFAPVSLATLVDSPVIAGAHFRAVPLKVEGAPPHEIDLASDSEAAILMSPDLQRHYADLVAEAHALFGVHHYRQYHFLLTLSDHVRRFGLEHHESSDNRLGERALLDPAERLLGASLLPHEFVHSWNGKFRRPAGLTTPDYQQPMKGELLWVYEGLTQYLGTILTARSGLFTPQQLREDLAAVAAYLDNRPGRTWRPLLDTTIAAQTLYGGPEAWASWRRGVDFYDESTLIWLEADTVIRQQTKGQKSLDDFCRLFHGGTGSAPEVKPYTFDDVVAALNQVAPYDWRAFLTQRLTSTAPHAPLGGLEAGGWRLVFNDTPNDILAAREAADGTVDLSYSLGLLLKYEVAGNPGSTLVNGALLDVIPGSPAARAGLGPGMKLVAVNGRRWSPVVLRAALRAAQQSKEPITLLVENAEFFQTYAVDYYGGERYPHLERDTAKPDLLGDITRPHARPQP